MKTNWIRGIIGGLSFTTALFVFQACYGTPQDLGDDILVEGQVKSKVSGLPVKGIKVSVAATQQYQMTDNDGKFSFYTEWGETLTVRFQDIDSAQNGSFMDKDTLVTKLSGQIYLDIALEEK
jgi:hypothetical protein